jgi:hypothetical protein
MAGGPQVLFLDSQPVSTWFERISIMVILLNCVTLGMYQPCENIHCTSDRCQILQVRGGVSRV